MQPTELIVKSDPKVKQVFDNYPEQVKVRLLELRELILQIAKESPEVKQLEESLKWGEPSYRSNVGSTVRIDWKASDPSRYAMYFQCTSRLVDTFRMMFSDHLQFDGKRAILFNLEEDIPMEQLALCVQAGLTYHKVKHLPTLGI